MVCKQGYLPKGVDGSLKRWQEDFLQDIGLGELSDRGFDRLGGVDGEVCVPILDYRNMNHMFKEANSA